VSASVNKIVYYYSAVCDCYAYKLVNYQLCHLVPYVSRQLSLKHSDVVAN